MPRMILSPLEGGRSRSIPERSTPRSNSSFVKTTVTRTEIHEMAFSNPSSVTPPGEVTGSRTRRGISAIGGYWNLRCCSKKISS